MGMKYPGSDNRGKRASSLKSVPGLSLFHYPFFHEVLHHFPPPWG
jgi:hypothetical protein